MIEVLEDMTSFFSLIKFSTINFLFITSENVSENLLDPLMFCIVNFNNNEERAEDII